MSRDQALADYLASLVTLHEIADADSERVRQVPAEGGWSAAWVLHHLADAEIVNADRLRRMVAENEPVLHTVDEEGWPQALHYDRRDPRESFAVVEACRRSNVGLLVTLSDAEWERTGAHPVNGVITIDRWMRSQTEHLRNHVDQALEAMSDNE